MFRAWRRVWGRILCDLNLHSWSARTPMEGRLFCTRRPCDGS